MDSIYRELAEIESRFSYRVRQFRANRLDLDDLEEIYSTPSSAPFAQSTTRVESEFEPDIKYWSDNSVYSSNSQKNDEVEVKKEKRKKIDENVYCICRKPEYGEMVCCDVCDEWFHFDCMMLKEAPSFWLCPKCKTS